MRHGTLYAMFSRKIPLSLLSILFLLHGCSDDQQTETQVEQKQATHQEIPVAPPTQKPVQTTTRGSDITFEIEEFDFGTIWDHESMTAVYPFTNTGTQTLVITRMKAGCGCTTPVADKTVIQPGESGTITVTFDPRGKQRKQDKKITIYTNSPVNSEKALWIRSTVKPYIEVDNKFLMLNEMKMGEPESIEFNIYPSDPNYKIQSITGVGKHGQYVSAKEIEVPDGAPRRIRINVAPNKPWGAFHSQVLIQGVGKMPDGSDTNHTLTIFANGKTFGKIRASNHIMSIGTLPPGAAYNKKIKIFREDGDQFEVLNTSVTQPTVAGMNAVAIPEIDGSYSIIVSGTLPATHTGPINAQIVVQTDVPGEEVLSFRAAGVVPKRN